MNNKEKTTRVVSIEEYKFLQAEKRLIKSLQQYKKAVDLVTDATRDRDEWRNIIIKSIKEEKYNA